MNNAAELSGSDCGTARADRCVSVRGSGEEVIIDNRKVRGVGYKSTWEVVARIVKLSGMGGDRV